MLASRTRVALASLVVLAGLAGCGGVFGAGAVGSTPTSTLTPAPIPDTPSPVVTSDPSGTPSDSPTRVTVTPWTRPSGPVRLDSGGSPSGESRSASPRPNCERPPGLVVHIQIVALANNDPGTNEGINTTWQFSAPSNRRLTGPYPVFVELITSRYRPLLDAETAAYDPITRIGGQAIQRVTVTTADGVNATYSWSLERQGDGRYEGCWMTVGVVGPI